MSSNDKPSGPPWVHLPTHPVGRYTFFIGLLRNGVSVADMSKKHGMPVPAIERYLSYERVHPELLAYYLNGKATAGQIHILSLVDDQALQLQIFAKLLPDDRGIENIAKILRSNFELKTKKKT